MILGEVDLLTCKHCVPCILNSSLLSQIHQHLKHIFVDLVLAVVEQEWPVVWSLQLDGELVKHLLHVDRVLVLVEVLLERTPCLCLLQSFLSIKGHCCDFRSRLTSCRSESSNK